MRATIGRVAAATTVILAFGSAALYAGEAIVEPTTERVVVADLTDGNAGRTALQARVTVPSERDSQAEQRKVRVVGPSFFPDE